VDELVVFFTFGLARYDIEFDLSVFSLNNVLGVNATGFCAGVDFGNDTFDAPTWECDFLEPTNDNWGIWICWHLRRKFGIGRNELTRFGPLRR